MGIIRDMEVMARIKAMEVKITTSISRRTCRGPVDLLCRLSLGMVLALECIRLHRATVLNHIMVRIRRRLATAKDLTWVQT